MANKHKTLDRQTPPELFAFPPISVPQPNMATLNNGIEVYWLDLGNQPINRITLSFDSGLLETNSPDALQIAAQLMREGTASLSGREISEQLDYEGAWLKIDTLSHNSMINLWSLNKSTLKLLPILKDIVTSPTFPESEFATIRDKQSAKARLSLKRAPYVASLIDKRQVFGTEHPMCRVLTPDEIDAVTRGDIIDAHRAAFMTRPRVFVVGEVKEMIHQLIEYFQSWPYVESGRKQKIMPMRPLKGGSRAEQAIDAEHQAAVELSIPTIGREHPDYIALRLAVMALGGYFGSRLMSNIREDKGYTYGIQANLLGYREGGVLSITSSTAPQYVEPLIAETVKEIARLATEPMEDAELHIVKNTAMTALAATLDSPFNIMDHHITHFHAATPERYFEKQLHAINSLTAHQIQDLMARHLPVDKLLISIAKPKA